MDGAADRASVKQIMHMSSASCLRLTSRAHRCRQGRHSVSPRTPPHQWPQLSSLVQALRECSCNTESAANGLIDTRGSTRLAPSRRLVSKSRLKITRRINPVPGTASQGPQKTVLMPCLEPEIPANKAAYSRPLSHPQTIPRKIRPKFKAKTWQQLK
jgi:hypothetical protein